MTNRPAGNASVPWFRESEVFTSGAEGYHTFRIPCMVVATDGTILAFCEGRRDGRDDFYALYLVLKRSTDNGATWEDMQVLAGDGEHTMHNPCAVVDRDTGTIWFSFNRDCDNVYMMSSEDNGKSWSSPADISRDVRLPSWTSYFTGTAHGIQLKNGRLVFPCTHAEGLRRDWIYLQEHVFYSDDHGSSWKVGGSIKGGVGEGVPVETDEGRIYMALRASGRNLGKRACAWSEDGGLSWSEKVELDDLPDPDCQGSITRFTDRDSHDKNRVVFANCATTEARENLTVRVSYDECKTWATSKVVHAGPAAYSDMAVATDMTICCLYERGVSHPYESIRLAQFNIEWLTEGADQLARA